MITFYVGLSSFFLLIMGIAWNRENIVNIVVKIICILLAIWGIVASLQLNGYIIKSQTLDQIENEEN